ncbi:Choline dehydrogenase [Halobacillus karajensis]|uniref:Gluconate 2-dehydrogenase flavoprotein n=1 Tax=Halobacillus karajensis TaxID=195088 RepID=A0A024P867_9BACI|nr:GMC family oxidoreductase N-terminal domain-containing protein [Halobacillus karajensis]CDQ20048.1 Gluconate 2-dehydrogenase flavoprotein precursor [Halobacillus karajensis]CDQ25289.1 Gluconate 2-dehydrogenase flavoprotein precursor [Halobacillus karajensis]CDQ28350.1 Gluconate 2-dehydrogenase flavoprotein precursor [Halobacillus karajensis]SEH67526.1 Choline dehydrogenase [Halobacillus karajensis]
MKRPDVIVIGSGGGGAVIAKELGELGLNVLMLEAGPWYGNINWPSPNIEKGGVCSSSPDDLDVNLFKESYNKLENNMNDLIAGKLRWGPANREHPPWNRSYQQRGFAWQISGVGGTTQHYLANSPRAFPSAINGKWPLTYRELIPFYEKVEDELPVEFAPTTSKEELFYFGAKKAGWKLINTLNVVSPGFRPQPNAIFLPNANLLNPAYSEKQLSWMEGCTLSGHCINGCPHGPSVSKIAKRSTNVSYVPAALNTGNVKIQPNTFSYQVVTENDPKEGVRAIGVKVRNTWTGERDELSADCIVVAAGAIETPRLWLNSSLPYNRWIGRGLVNHNMDMVTGVFNENELFPILGSNVISPFVGHTSGARLDYPGLGSIQINGVSPGLMASFTYAFSESGTEKSPHTHTSGKQGRVTGEELIELMADYQKSCSILIVTDDEVDRKNRVSTLPAQLDENGAIPSIHYTPTRMTQIKKRKLVKIASDILLQAGARKVIHSNWPSGLMIHIMSTMRMGYVVDQNSESYQVGRLFIADNSILTNGLGGANPTLTTQALAVRTAGKIYKKYF